MIKLGNYAIFYSIAAFPSRPHCEISNVFILNARILYHLF